MSEFLNKGIDEIKNTEFVYNDPANGKLVLSTLEKQLNNCDKFQISVAFITEEGIVPFYQLLKELEDKNIKGEILTTNYLTFSEPKALDKLNSYKNIELKMFDVRKANIGFHTKAYIFKKDNKYEMVIGSSNLTEKALKINKEWNIKITTDTNLELQKEILTEFDKMWNSEYSYSYDEISSTYKTLFEYNAEQRKQFEDQGFNKEGQLVPNVMQRSFIENLEAIYNSGKNKALLISATGTGKTFASAFGMQALKFKKVLFVVHRYQIAKQAKESYERVFNNTRTFGLLGGGKDESNADFIFATVQTLSKDEYLNRFSKDRFDCVILDEAHHSSADVFQKIMNYFKPKLWLGMTATPDRRDSDQKGKNIYEIFDYQIAYEIRLQQAMEEDLLCPFHYFGISDIKVENNDDEIDFNDLVSDQRVKHIIEQAEYYGHSGERVKGLIFASRIKECVELSNKFNDRGYRTLVLDGSMSDEKRQDAFDRLAMDRKDATKDKVPLDYIFSVDVLNEGVDIVEVNQVIMLRPTQSPIVFIQQLGRGLRKAKDKKHVIVLDFISNYKKNNYMIPIALSGDRSYNKDNIRRCLLEGNCLIPGISTIHFDEISKQRIFESIDNTNFSEINFIKNSYKELKDMLGRIPTVNDFEEYGRMDIQNIFDNKSLGSYYKFLAKYEEDYKVRLNQNEDLFIEFISRKFVNGKRPYELQLLNTILNNVNTKALFKEFELINKKLDRNLKTNLVNILTNEFPTGTGKDTYKECVFIKENKNDYEVSDVFKECLSNSEFKKQVKELVEFGLNRNKERYSNTYKDSEFVLYKKYTYEDVCRMLDFACNLVATNIGGYYYDEQTNSFPVFINYKKDDNISLTTQYEDRFISNDNLIAISKSNRHKDSKDVNLFLNSDKLNIKVDLFVRKNKDDKQSKEFYYLGRMHPTGYTKEFTMNNTNSTAVEIGWKLEVPVRDDILDYLESDIEVKDENC